jgi:hypothetical protein
MKTDEAVAIIVGIALGYYGVAHFKKSGKAY